MTEMATIQRETKHYRYFTLSMEPGGDSLAQLLMDRVAVNFRVHIKGDVRQVASLNLKLIGDAWMNYDFKIHISEMAGVLNMSHPDPKFCYTILLPSMVPKPLSGRILLPGETDEDFLQWIDDFLESDEARDVVKGFHYDKVMSAAPEAMKDHAKLIEFQRLAAVEEVLGWMPDDFVEAHHAGETAENKPDYDEGYQVPSYDDTWEINIYYTNWRTEGGILYECIDSSDMDGNTDFVSEAEVGTPEHEEQREIYTPSGDAWKEYWEFCVETGTDPLDQIMTPSSIEHDVTTEFEIAERRSGLVLVRWRIEGERWESGLPPDVPDDLMEFVNGKVIKGEIVLQDFENSAALLDGAQAGDIVRQSDGTIRGKFTRKVTVDVDEDVRAAEIRRIAARHD